MPTASCQHPALTADVVVIALGESTLDVLLVRRAGPPFQGSWALPGGFVNLGESPCDAASRELEEETGIRATRLEQLRAFGDPGRDPRGHTVTVAYLSVVAARACPRAQAGSDASQARWWPISDLPALAFDHAEILTVALQKLRLRLSGICAVPDAEEILPSDLTISDLRLVYGAIVRSLGNDVDGYEG